MAVLMLLLVFFTPALILPDDTALAFYGSLNAAACLLYSGTYIAR